MFGWLKSLIPHARAREKYHESFKTIREASPRKLSSAVRLAELDDEEKKLDELAEDAKKLSSKKRDEYLRRIDILKREIEVERIKAKASYRDAERDKQNALLELDEAMYSIYDPR